MNEIQEYRNEYFNNSLVLKMDEVPTYDKSDYDLFNEKEFKKYIDAIEKLVRSSREYRLFVQYLRQYQDMKDSMFLENVSNSESAKIRIELHHVPFTLYDIVVTVYNKRSQLQEPLDVELVALEVAQLHYFLVVGLVPLSKTEHKLVHNQELFIPIDKVYGNYKKFIDIYGQYIPDDIMEKYKTYENMSKNYNHDENTKILQISPTFIKMPDTDDNTLGTYNLAMLNQVMMLTQQKMSQLTERSPHMKNIEENKYDNTKTLIKPFKIGV